MKLARLGDLVIGERPVMVVTAAGSSVEEMIGGAAVAVDAGADCVELRVDRLGSREEISEVIGAVTVPHIVACRTPAFGGGFLGTEQERVARLQLAVAAGATAVDIEFFTDPDLRTQLLWDARRRGTPVLVGYENMHRTPPEDELVGGLRSIAELEPDLIKLAVRATSYEDLLVVLSTALRMSDSLEVPFAAIALGAHGAPARPLGCLLGGSFTYCAVQGGVVPGQLTVAETRSVLETLSGQRWSCSSN